MSPPPPTVSRAIAIMLKSDPQEVRRARAVVRDTLTSWGLEPLADDLGVVASELVGNAVRHGGGPITLMLVLQGGVVRLEIGDVSPRMPVVRDPDADTESGRGLQLVSGLCQAWGYRPRRGGAGKTVWCTMAAGWAGTALPRGGSEPGPVPRPALGPGLAFRPSGRARGHP